MASHNGQTRERHSTGAPKLWADGAPDAYRELFAANPQPQWVLDRQSLDFLAVNRAAVQFFGAPGSGEGVGTGEELPPEDLVNLVRQHQRLLGLQEGEQPAPSATLPYRRGNGAALVLEVKVRPLAFAGKDAVLCLAVDVTESSQTGGRLGASEKRFRALVENCTDVVLLLAPDGTILYDAPSPGRVLGYGDEAFVGRNAFTFVHPEDQEAARKQLADVQARPGGTATAHLRARHKDGSWRWVEAVGSNLLDEPNVRAVVVNYRDITERRRVEEALRQSQQRFEALVNSIEGIVWEAELPSLRFTFVSRQAERLLGYPPERWLAEPNFWKDHLDPRDRDGSLAQCHHGLAAGRPHDFEYRLRAADGRAVWLRDLVTVVCEGGRPVKLRGVMFDVTRRKEAEARLRESEERHRLVTELTSDYTYTLVVRPDGNLWLESATEGFVRVTGFTVAELQRPGRETDFIHPEDLDLVREKSRLWRDGQRDEGELRVRRKDGTVRWVRYSVHPIRENGAGRVVRLLGAGQDITERKRTEEALKRLLRQHELILSAADEGIYGVDRHGRTTFVNPAAARMFGRQPQEMVGRDLHALIHHHRPDGTAYPPADCPILASLRDGKVRKVSDEAFWRADGTSFPVEYISTPVWEDGELAGAVVTFSDVTEQRRVGEKLQESAERLRLLSGRLLEVQELERRRLATELHDEIGQTLTGLNLSLGMSANLGEDALRAAVREAQTTIKHLTSQVRDISLRLRPTVLDDFGLLPALLWLFERYTSQTGVDVAFEHEGLDRRLRPPEVETAAYRVVQEALTNVARYAGVTDVTVRIWVDAGLLCLQIQDEGAGFDPQEALARGASSGLSGMQERAALLGGVVVIDSGPGLGTRVSAELPVSGVEERRRPNVFDPFPGRRSSDRPAGVESAAGDDPGPPAGR